MKIGFVLDDSLDRPDGVQQAIIVLGNALKKHGHEVHYLVSNTSRQDIENIHSLAKNIKVSFNGNKLSTPLPTTTDRLKTFLKAEKFDVLHVQMPYSPYFAARIIMSAPKKTKIVGTFHILPYKKINLHATRLLAKILKKSLLRFDSVISVSKPAQIFCEQAFGIKSIVVPNPVSITSFSNSVPLKKSKKIKRVVFLGRLVPRKGILDLLTAYEEFIKCYSKFSEQVELVIAGKGPLESEIRKRLKKSKGKIKYIGFVEEQNKASLLASADLAVFPSISGESFGIVLIEAMASGAKLILGGANPGYESVLGDQPELLINPKRHKEFSQKLYQLLQETKANQDLSKWLERQVHQYDADVVCQKVMQLYQS